MIVSTQHCLSPLRSHFQQDKHISPSSSCHKFPTILSRWYPYCRQFARSVKEQEKFITQPFFSPPSPLLTYSGETKLRQQASGESITGPLLFQSWGHPPARRSRNKGQGFIAGPTVWKETQSNIVWFLEMVDSHSYCFRLIVYHHVITITARRRCTKTPLSFST